MPSKKRPLFFDTVVLSNFAFAEGGIPFLKERYKGRGKVTIQVYQELMKAIYGGYQQLEQVLDIFKRETLTEKETSIYMPLLKNLGEGEASCLAAASQRQGIVVTDDRAARNFCLQMELPVTGTIGILKAGCLDHQLNPKQADLMLDQMVRLSGYYSPINKISDIL